MRQKKAKALRKKAREISKGMPERLLIDTTPARIKHRGIFSTVKNHPNSTRGIYLSLKRKA